MWFIVIFCASPTPAQEIEQRESCPVKLIAQLRAVEDEVLHTGRPLAAFHLNTHKESKQTDTSFVG